MRDTLKERRERNLQKDLGLKAAADAKRQAATQAFIGQLSEAVRRGELTGDDAVDRLLALQDELVVEFPDDDFLDHEFDKAVDDLLAALEPDQG